MNRATPPTREQAPVRTRDAGSVTGYAIGVGLATVAVLGTLLHFWQPEWSSWLVYPLSFVVGALLGAALATVRGVLPGGRKH